MPLLGKTNGFFAVNFLAAKIFDASSDNVMVCDSPSVLLLGTFHAKVTNLIIFSEEIIKKMKLLFVLKVKSKVLEYYLKKYKIIQKHKQHSMLKRVTTNFQIMDSD